MLLVAALAWSCAGWAAAPVVVHVDVRTLGDVPVSGRLLVFAIDAASARAKAKGAPIKQVDVDPFAPTEVDVAAGEVHAISHGHGVDIDASRLAWPREFASLPPGDYVFQAVLDTNHDYAYRGRSGGDLESAPTPVHLPTTAPVSLTLDHMMPRRQPWVFPPGALSQSAQRYLARARESVHPIDFVSPALTAFWGHPIHMRGWVLLPPGYEASGQARYPVVYDTHGFGGDDHSLSASAVTTYSAMAEKQMPPMIWVYLDQSSATGTHEFADSVNNGPWGKALTQELIPSLESRYRMDARASGRLLTGHSSGGWAALWLQTHYPKIFGGVWATSPDPVDFGNFSGVDLYAPHANLYRRADGSLTPIMRDHDKVIDTFEGSSRMERVLGAYGGQMASFEWVFSPRGPDGRPMPMFDRDSGAIDPDVVAYWRDHYDIVRYLVSNWPVLRPNLDGRLHVYVGDVDTFYLDGAVHRLQEALVKLDAHADIRFIPGKGHFDLCAEGNDHNALLRQISWAMYSVARPGQASCATPAHGCTGHGQGGSKPGG
ncbi:MAG TPA: alpha/beta hydrolase-fold protein [Dyella sp.]